MDAFESLVSMLLRHEGYWTIPNYRVELTKEDKGRIKRPSCPRWELDIVAYRARTNSVLVVECKSYLDSTGVHFREGAFRYPQRYKLFTEDDLWETISERLGEQLHKSGMCRKAPKVQLALAVGKFAKATKPKELRAHFKAHGHRLLGPKWVQAKLEKAATRGYENDTAFIVSKLLKRKKIAASQEPTR